MVSINILGRSTHLQDGYIVEHLIDYYAVLTMPITKICGCYMQRCCFPNMAAQIWRQPLHRQRYFNSFTNIFQCWKQYKHLYRWWFKCSCPRLHSWWKVRIPSDLSEESLLCWGESYPILLHIRSGYAEISNIPANPLPSNPMGSMANSAGSTANRVKEIIRLGKSLLRLTQSLSIDWFAYAVYSNWFTLACQLDPSLEVMAKAIPLVCV